MNEREMCSECGRWVSGEDSHTFDGEVLCEDCYHEKTAECDCCGRRIWREDSEGNESIVLCQRCWDDRYTTCEECGALIPNDEAWYEDGGDFPYCHECFNRKRNRPIKQYNYKPIFIQGSERNPQRIGTSLQAHGSRALRFDPKHSLPI